MNGGRVKNYTESLDSLQRVDCLLCRICCDMECLSIRVCPNDRLSERKIQPVELKEQFMIPNLQS